MGGIIQVVLVFTLLVALPINTESSISDEVLALNKIMEAIHEDPSRVLSNWSGLGSDPCRWRGVSCSVAGDHVVKLNISHTSSKGFLAPELGLLPYLEQLILNGNNLSGTIPKEIGRLKSLKVLDLGENQLSGSIPSWIGNLTNLTTINLQSNGLTGAIPPELLNLKNLQELRVNRNKLRGTFPASYGTEKLNDNEMYGSAGKNVAFCHSPKLKVADFSYNFLTGRIPKCLLYLPRSSFQGNCLVEKATKQRSNSQCGLKSSPPMKGHPMAYDLKHQPQDDTAKHQHLKPGWILALEIASGTLVGIVFFFAILTAFKRCNSKSAMIIPWKKSSSDKDRLAVHIDSEVLKDVQRYRRHELEVACEDFSNIIESSPASVIYKGTIKGGPEIAVISFCVKEGQWNGRHELRFQHEVADLARLNHENAGKLVGYCSESSPITRMLVFEYASYGTLAEHLHYGDGCQLTWSRRMKIIIGIARGLKYLHTELYPPFTITELNSSSVYLTEDFSPKLVDFESWKNILAKKNLCSAGSKGSLISIASNSTKERDLDMKVNVYNFGVMILEIVSGRAPCSNDHGSLIDWVELHKVGITQGLSSASLEPGVSSATTSLSLEARARDYVDLPEMMCNVVDPQLTHFENEDLKVVCEVASRSIDPDIGRRPPVDELCATLESRISLSLSAELRSSLAWAELALDT